MWWRGSPPPGSRRDVVLEQLPLLRRHVFVVPVDQPGKGARGDLLQQPLQLGTGDPDAPVVEPDPGLEDVGIDGAEVRLSDLPGRDGFVELAALRPLKV